MKNIDISSAAPAYFQYADGRTYIPIGLNLCMVRNDQQLPEEEVLAKYRFWMESLARNGGNYTRIYLGVPFFDVMPEKFGVFSDKNLSHIKTVLSYAEALGIKIKFTFELFRRISPTHSALLFPGAISMDKVIYHGIFRDMHEFLTSGSGRQAYLDKVRYLADAGLGESAAVFAWEFWNEINCTGPIADWLPWSEYMYGEVGRIFPKQMIVQNIGSYSESTGYQIYDAVCQSPCNDFLQVHRYLDPGAAMDVCRGPADVLAADAIGELRRRCPLKPAIIAEVGAVEANHSRYSHLYENDCKGVLLHDQTFAPFFAGSAGTGQSWHWDYIYVEKHNLYWHFARFARALRGIDPVAERFEPYYTETHELRIYGLRGRKQTILWCRDKHSHWQTEIEGGIKAPILESLKIPRDLEQPADEYSFYDPWSEAEGTLTCSGARIELPPFQRSIVVYMKQYASG